MSLQDQVNSLRAKLSSATSTLATLERDANDTIGGQLSDLRDALVTSTERTQKVLDKHRKRRYSLAVVQTRTHKAMILQASLDKLIEGLEEASRLADTSRQTSMDYCIKASDFQNVQLKPTKNSVAKLKVDVDDEQQVVRSNLTTTKSQTVAAQQARDAVQNDIRDKENVIRKNEAKLRSNRDQLDNVRARQRWVAQQRAEQEARAARLREEASHNRRKAAWVGVLTLGLGVGYSVGCLLEADDQAEAARQAGRRGGELSSDLRSLESTSRSLASTKSSLNGDLTTLQASKRRMDADLAACSLRVSQLDSKIQRLNGQVRETRSLSTVVQGLEGSTSKLSMSVRELQLQLQDLKATLSDMADGVREHTDEATFVRKKASKLTITDEARDRVMARLKETLPKMERLTSSVVQECGRIGY